MYKHLQIVFVNSGSSCYGKFPLDSHTLLKATGNSGKSSILNALKFFWLPENSFSNCEKKFKLSNSKNGESFYSGEESFSYYFPSAQTSFIILELENNHGRHCQILYPRSRMGYGRILANCPYSEIEDLFWNLDAEDDLGFGEPSDNLTTKGVLAALTQREITFKDVNKVDELSSLLYSDSLLDQDAMYAIFPLKSQDAGAIETLRTLVHTICGFKAGSSELATLFANIIESRKKDESDYLNLDLSEILVERESLNVEEKSLNELESFRDIANAVFEIANFVGAADETLGLDFKSAEASVSAKLNDVREQSKAVVSEISYLDSQLKTKLAEKNNLDHEASATKGKLDACYGHYKGAADAMQAAIDVAEKEFHGMDIAGEGGIIEILHETIVEDERKLEQFQSKDKAFERHTYLTKRKTELHALIGELNIAIENFDSLLFKSLSSESQVVLSSLNNSFKQVASNGFDKASLTTIESFCSLFNIHEDSLSFGSVTFKLVSPDTSLEELTHNLTLYKNELSDVSSELEEFSDFKASDAKTQNTLKRALVKSIKKARDDIALLQQYLLIKENFSSIEGDFKSVESQLENINKDAELKAIEISKIQSDLRDKQQESSILTTKTDELLNMQSRLDQANNTSLYAVMLERVDQDKIDAEIEVTHDVIDKAAMSMGRYGKHVEKLKESLAVLVRDGVLEDPNKLSLVADATYYSMKPLIDNLKNKFDQIEPRRQNLHDSKASHKSIIAMKMQELTNNADVISVFGRKINTMFNNVSINNLEGVKVDIGLDPRFTDLVSQIAASDLYGEEDISDAFYDRLSAFIEAFFRGGKSAELTMSKIIKSVEFKTKKHGEDWVETSQSNSTTTLISITLLQLMMKEVMNNDIETALPLIIDEVAHIDESEFPWLIRNIEENGFRLLSASTNNISVYTLEEIGTECCIDEFKASKAYSAGRVNVFLGAEGCLND